MRLRARWWCGLSYSDVGLCKECFVRYFDENISQERDNTIGVNIARNQSVHRIWKGLQKGIRDQCEKIADGRREGFGRAEIRSSERYLISILISIVNREGGF